MRFYLLTSLLLIIGCASNKPVGITDTITFYPDNTEAEKWGVFKYTKQYISSSSNEEFEVTLPNHEIIKGQTTFLNRNESAVSYDTWSNFSFGYGYGRWGRSRWYGNAYFDRPNYYRVKSDTGTLQIDAFGDKTRLNCQGDYNQRKHQGLLNCDLSNGMKYKGHVRKYIVDLP